MTSQAAEGSRHGEYGLGPVPGTPQAAVLARARPYLGPARWQMLAVPAGHGRTDITAGTDTIPGMPGFTTRPGYDLPAGRRTVGNARQFTAALARASHPAPRGPLPARPRRQ